MPMKTSPAGVAAIRQREGCRFRTYLDSVGVPTIGVGHTGRSSPPVPRLGDVITSDQADAYLAGDLAPVEAAIADAVKRPLTQAQFDACASLAFNIGTHGFSGSTVVHKLNQNDIMGAADAFLMWEKPPELRGRRISERAQFLSTSAPAVASPPLAENFAPKPPHAVTSTAQPVGLRARILAWLRSLAA